LLHFATNAETKLMTKLQTIMFEHQVIDIHHNPNLSKKPYLVRIFSYNNHYPDEIRLDEIDFKNLYNILKRL